MVTLSHLKEINKALEIGCHVCGYHQFVDPSLILVAPETEIPDLSELLKCPQCGAENEEPNYPIWVRPDARPPLMGADV